jgi:hypothetical protein
MPIESKKVLAYRCLRCNKIHYAGEGLYKDHFDYRDKMGVQLRTIEKNVKKKQTSLVDFGFPKVNTNLKLGEKKNE